MDFPIKYQNYMLEDIWQKIPGNSHCSFKAGSVLKIDDLNTATI